MDTFEHQTFFERRLKVWVAAAPERTEGAFAELIGTSSATLSRAKRGKIRPDTLLLRRVCEALDLDADEAALLYSEGGHPLPAVLCASGAVEAA